MKAQSIENLFESPTQTDRHDTDTYSPRNLTPPRDKTHRPDTNKLYNTTVNHQLNTDHRKLAVSTTALNMPVSIGTLRGENLAIADTKCHVTTAVRSIALTKFLTVLSFSLAWDDFKEFEPMMRQASRLGWECLLWLLNHHCCSEVNSMLYSVRTGDCGVLGSLTRTNSRVTLT